MIHINEGQAQLSGWGYAAEPEALFINKVPEPFMVGQTISAAATRDRGGTSLKFKDGTVLLYHQGYGLFPPLTNVTVWTVPAEGTTVSNTLEYVEIHASYTTKKGKVIQAIPAKIPVAVPKFLRVIVPEEPLIDEGFYLNTIKSWDDTDESKGLRSAWFNKKAYLVVDWADKHDVIFRTTRCDDSKVTIYSTSAWDDGTTLQVRNHGNGATFTRYRTPEDTGTEMTFEVAEHIVFRYRINNTTLQGDTYAEINTIIDEGLFNLRESYAGETEYTIYLEHNTIAKYKNGKVIIGRHDYAPPYLDRWFADWDWMGYMHRYTQQTITLKDGKKGDIKVYMRKRFGNMRTYWYVEIGYHYECADGKVTWTKGEPYYN